MGLCESHQRLEQSNRRARCIPPVGLALLQLGCTLSMLSLTVVAGRLARRGLRRGLRVHVAQVPAPAELVAMGGATSYGNHYGDG